MVVRNIQLDGLRGVAALNVAVFHTILGIDGDLMDRYGKLSDLSGPHDWFAKAVLKLFNGETAVFVFFVLSGVVLFNSLMRERAPLLAKSFTFSIRRIFRIYPAMIASLLFNMAVFVWFENPFTISDFLINSTLYDFRINGVTWTLNVEMVGVAFVLLVYLAWRIGGVAGMLVTFIGSWVFFRMPDLPFPGTFRGFWIYFALGMIVPTKVGKNIASRLPSWSIAPVLLIAIIFKGTLQQISIGLLVTMIYYSRAGFFGRWLEAPVCQFLGRISYSFYLFNFAIFVYVCGYAKRLDWINLHPIEGGLLTSLFTVGLTIPIAYLSMRYVEIPGIALGRLVTFKSRMPRPREIDGFQNAS
ncbi:acyltransferase family protein [Tardiphaga sp. 813_E8_N1_3]|uniref:acyltransferase family protein n=1 Tax=Tardiphaga sp. 813_E8_N1_3 TaxID=3240760 RepID=UPI003F292100